MRFYKSPIFQQEKESMFIHPEVITIHLHMSGTDVRDVVVHPGDQIQVLDQEVKGEDKRYIIFNNNILLTSFSFKFFGIKDGDHLYVLRAPRNPSRQSQKQKNLLQKAKNAYSFVKMGNDNVEAIDRSAVKECIRLLDLMCMRDESRPFCGRRAIQEKPVVERKAPEQRTPEWSRAMEPATKTLPIFWSNRKGRMLQPNL